MSTWLYDEHGVPRMRLIYDGRILDIEDNLVGCVSLSEGAVYTSDLRHVGWFKNGLIRDNDSWVVAFTRDASDPDMPGLPDPVIAVIDYSFWANTLRLGSPRAGFAPTNVVLDFMPHFYIGMVLDKRVSKYMF